ncbi:MAG: glycosyltransferase family 39 protein [Pseudomonadota bacterium]
MNAQRLSSTVCRILLTLICLAILAGLGAWIRWPATKVNSFRNEDVAGITYNADLLGRAMVPMVDSLEMKAPGSFFVTWGVWSVWGRSIQALESFGVAWAILAAFGVFFAGRMMFGFVPGFLAAILYTLYAPYMDSMTVNYNSWMLPAYVWCTVFFIGGLKSGRLWWFVACGISLALAALLKRQGAVLFPLFVVVIWFAPYLTMPLGWPQMRRRGAFIAYLAGVAVGFLPIVIFYLAKGNIGSLITNFFFSESGWRYVGGELDWSDKFERLEDGFLGFWKFMLLPAIFATLTIVSVPLERKRGLALLGLLLGGHFFCSLIGLSLGFRFYKGYYLQALPAAIWLACHPDGPLLRWFQKETWPSNWRLGLGRVGQIVLVAILVAVAGQRGLNDLKYERRGRTGFNRFQKEAEMIAQFVRDNTTAKDRIWVWGRWAWPIYFHANRLSVTRYYKVLGVITNNLTNTWRRPTEMTRFEPIGPYEKIGKQLNEGKPAFIVAALNEDYQGFEALEKLLREEYERTNEIRVTGFHIYRLKKGEEKPKE